MKSTVENLSPTRVRLAVEVPFNELEPSLKAAYQRIGGQIRVPGFRPGKVPARVIDQRVGRAAVLEEAVNETLPRVYGEATREHDLQPLGQPEVDVTSLEDGKTLNFTAEVDIRPEVPVPDLDDLAITVADAEVTDADIDEQLQSLRERFGTLNGVERPVADGDFVNLDLVAEVGGERVADGTAEGISYQVGSDELIDGLDEAIIGTSAGDRAEFTADLQQGERAGTEATIGATVNSVKERELPEVDDEFAQLASEFDTVEEMRADLRERLGRAKLLEQGSEARDKLIEQLIDSVEFPLPESAVQAEVDGRMHDIVHSLGHDDALFDRFLQMQGTTREEYTEQLRENAEKAVRAQFILDAISEKRDVQVADAEFTEFLIRQAARYQMAPQEFAQQMMQAGNLPVLVADVRRSKALSQLLESATITDASGRSVDLEQLSRLAAEADAEEEAAAAQDAAGEGAAAEWAGEQTAIDDDIADAVAANAEIDAASERATPAGEAEATDKA